MVEGRKAEGSKETHHRRVEHEATEDGRIETTHLPSERSLEADPKDLGKTPSKLYQLASEGMEELTGSGRFKNLGHELAKGFLEFEHKLFHFGEKKDGDAANAGKDANNAQQGKDTKNKDSANKDGKTDNDAKDGKTGDDAKDRKTGDDARDGLKDLKLASTDNKDGSKDKDPANPNKDGNPKETPKAAFGLEPLPQGFTPSPQSENVKIVPVKVVNDAPASVANKPDAPQSADPLEPKKVTTIKVTAASTETLGNTPILPTNTFSGSVDMSNVRIVQVRNVNPPPEPEKTPLAAGPCDLKSAPDALKPVSFEDFQKSLNIAGQRPTDAAQKAQPADPCVLNANTPPLTMANMQAALRGDPLPDRPPPTTQSDQPPPAVPALPNSVMFDPTPIAQQRDDLQTQQQLAQAPKPGDPLQPNPNQAAMDQVMFNPTPIAQQNPQNLQPQVERHPGNAAAAGGVARVPAGGPVDSSRPAADPCVYNPNTAPFTIEGMRAAVYGNNPPANPAAGGDRPPGPQAPGSSQNPLAPGADAAAANPLAPARAPSDLSSAPANLQALGPEKAGTGSVESPHRSSSNGGGSDGGGGTGRSSSSSRSSSERQSGSDITSPLSSSRPPLNDDNRWSVGMNLGSKSTDNSSNPSLNRSSEFVPSGRNSNGSADNSLQPQSSRVQAANETVNAQFGKNQETSNVKAAENLSRNEQSVDKQQAELAQHNRETAAKQQEQITATQEQSRVQRESEEKKRSWEAEQSKFLLGPGSNGAKGDSASSAQKTAEALNLSTAGALARMSMSGGGITSLDALTGNAGTSSKGSGDRPGTVGGAEISGPVSLASLKASSAVGSESSIAGARAISASDATAGANTGVGRSFFGDAGKGASSDAASLLLGGKGAFALDINTSTRAASIDAMIAGKLNAAMDPSSKLNTLDPSGKNMPIDGTLGVRGLNNGNPALSGIPGLHGKDYSVDAQGRVTRVDPITGRVIIMDGVRPSDFQLTELIKLQNNMQGNNKRYLTGVEIAIAAAIASVAIAKKRPDQLTYLSDGELAANDMKNLLSDADGNAKDQADNDENDKSGTSNNQTASLFKRPTMIVAHNDSLVEISEKLFHDSDVAWLIADINRDNITEHEEDGKRIIELRSRQEIQLPLPSEVQDFLLRRDKDAVANKIVTIVTVSEIDRELLNSFLNTVVGGAASEEEPSRVPVAVGAAGVETEQAPAAVLFPTARPALMELMSLSKALGNNLMPTMNALRQQGRSLATYISKIDMLLPPPPAVHALKPEVQP